MITILISPKTSDIKELTMLKDENLDTHLSRLIQETCGQSPNTLERQRGLNQLVLLIQKSGKLYQDHQLLSIDYEDALQKTWLYFCRNLCEAVTAKNGPYDAEKGNIFTWLNAYLKKRILDAHLASQQAKEMIVSPRLDDQGNIIDPVENIPNPKPSDNRANKMFVKIQQWLQSQEKRLSRIHLRDRPEINAYVLILRRLPPEETTWETLAQEWNISRSTLANFYQRRCLPLLQELREQF